jgi:hypothetical protein
MLDIFSMSLTATFGWATHEPGMLIPNSRLVLRPSRLTHMKISRVTQLSASRAMEVLLPSPLLARRLCSAVLLWDSRPRRATNPSHTTAYNPSLSL